MRSGTHDIIGVNRPEEGKQVFKQWNLLQKGIESLHRIAVDELVGFNFKVNTYSQGK